MTLLHGSTREGIEVANLPEYTFAFENVSFVFPRFRIDLFANTVHVRLDGKRQEYNVRQIVVQSTSNLAVFSLALPYNSGRLPENSMKVRGAGRHYYFQFIHERYLFANLRNKLRSKSSVIRCLRSFNRQIPSFYRSGEATTGSIRGLCLVLISKPIF